MLEECDIVYCWIWGEHPRVRALFRENGQDIEPHRSHSHSFIVRSIELVRRNMPWHRGRIVVVSACGLEPPGIDLALHRVEVIDQDAILPAAHRPAFNNMVVESALHRVPRLTEIFVYMNDDQFVLRPIPQDVFINVDRQITFFRNEFCTMEDLRRRCPPRTNVWVDMSLRTARLARDEWGASLTSIRTLQHMPYVLRRDDYQTAMQVFERPIDEMGRRHTVRHSRDVVVLLLYQEWCRVECPNTVRWACHHRTSECSYRCERLTIHNQEAIVEVLRKCSVSMLTLSELGGDTETHREFVLSSVQGQLKRLIHAEEEESASKSSSLCSFICGCGKRWTRSRPHTRTSG